MNSIPTVLIVAAALVAYGAVIPHVAAEEGPGQSGAGQSSVQFPDKFVPGVLSKDQAVRIVTHYAIIAMTQKPDGIKFNDAGISKQTEMKPGLSVAVVKCYQAILNDDLSTALLSVKDNMRNMFGTLQDMQQRRRVKSGTSGDDVLFGISITPVRCAPTEAICLIEYKWGRSGDRVKVNLAPQFTIHKWEYNETKAEWYLEPIGPLF